LLAGADCGFWRSLKLESEDERAADQTAIETDVATLKSEVASLAGNDPSMMPYVQSANALLDLLQRFCVDVNRVADALQKS
jgi:hypothetical protein